MKVAPSLTRQLAIRQRPGKDGMGYWSEATGLSRLMDGWRSRSLFCRHVAFRATSRATIWWSEPGYKMSMTGGLKDG